MSDNIIISIRVPVKLHRSPVPSLICNSVALRPSRMSKAPSAIIIRIIPTTHNILVVVVVVVMKPQGPVQLPFSSFLPYFLLQSPLFTIERKPALSFGIALVSMVLWFLFGGWWCFGHIAFLFCLEEEAPLITCGGGGFLFCMLMVDGGTRTQIDIEILKHTHTHTLYNLPTNCTKLRVVCECVPIGRARSTWAQRR